MFPDVNTGEALWVTTPPITTAAEVATVQLMHGGPNEHGGGLLVNLRPIGANKLFRATAAAKGKRLVVVVDGVVLATPRIHAPTGGEFQLSGGRINTEGLEVYKALTAN